MSNPRPVKSKIEKTLPLMNDPFISSYIPETCEFNLTNLKRMINKYPCLYIKPDNGSMGTGIIRLKELNSGKYELAYEQKKDILPQKDVPKFLTQKLNSSRLYIIQQGVDMATLNNCPFDLRVILQKVMGRWQLSLIYAKVALEENAIVTNIAKGNKRVPLEKVLIENDQKWDGYTILRHLLDASHQIADILGRKFPLRILGLDMAIDKNGEIWFFEANTRPVIKEELKEVTDQLSYEKYLEARQWNLKK